jgi:hypothetical protein
VGTAAGSAGPRSVYDVYVDLGANGYALEVMEHLGVVPEREAELELAAQNLTDAIASFGDYDQFVDSLRQTIAELSAGGGPELPEAGASRQLTLDAPRQAAHLLPAVAAPASGAGSSAAALPERAVPRLPEGKGKGPFRPSDVGLHATVDEALAALFGETPEGKGRLPDDPGALAAIVIGGVLGSLTTGGFWDGVARFMRQRRLKQMQSRLGDELAGLSLDLYHGAASVHEALERNLDRLVQDKRWFVECRRREVAQHRRMPQNRRGSSSWALKVLASVEARQALVNAQRDVRKLTVQIARHRRAGRHDLAGFLLYVNRHELLRGIESVEGRIAAIEEAGERLRQALLTEQNNEA